MDRLRHPRRRRRREWAEGCCAILRPCIGWALARATGRSLSQPVAHQLRTRPRLPPGPSAATAPTDRPPAASPPTYIYPNACRDLRRTCSSGPPPAPAGVRRRSGHLRVCTVYSGLRKPAFRRSSLHPTSPGGRWPRVASFVCRRQRRQRADLGSQFTRFSALERQRVRRHQPW